MAPDSGNIRVFVRWDDSNVVYAGDVLKATICFVNTSATTTTTSTQSQLKPPPSNHRAASSHPSHPSSRLAPPPSTPTSSSRRGHRPSSSLSVSPSKPTRSRAGSIPWMPTSHPPDTHQNNGNGNSHRRSVSIVSIGSVTSVDSQATSNAGSNASRPRGHGRSASLQIVSRSPRSGGFSLLDNLGFYRKLIHHPKRLTLSDPSMHLPRRYIMPPTRLAENHLSNVRPLPPRQISTP